MTTQQATTVMAAPLKTVHEQLRDVMSWPGFVSGLVAVEQLGFERYRFTLTEGGGRREVPVCVVDDPAGHRMSWHQLEGPRYSGEVRLRAVDAGHTRVELRTTADPTGFAAGLREMLGERHPTAELDLRRLEELIAAGDRRLG
jgi:uncharacterized membrane protein